jgi:hypothetical protein
MIVVKGDVMERTMVARVALVAAALFSTIPAIAGDLSGEEAKRLIAGKLFSYNCFDGTTGAGRIQANGAVSGTIRMQGKGPMRHAVLPVGTLRVKGNAVCATMKGMMFEPCFRVVQTSSRTFRGSISGMGFAYCDFVHRGGRVDVARVGASRRPMRLGGSAAAD